MATSAAKQAAPPAHEPPPIGTHDARPVKRTRKVRHICSLGTGEVVHILYYKALADKVDDFELVVQGLARCLYSIEASVTDVRVCHPACGEVVFIVTFITKDALAKFQAGPQAEFETSLRGLTVKECTKEGQARPCFSASGTMMPAAHTLDSLLAYLKANVKGHDHTAHDVRAVSRELEKWFPRPSEFSKYIKTNEADPTKYTRNTVFCNDDFDCILMCWPPGCASSIHDHDVSSCWVNVVEGNVTEVQYALPRLDKKFLEAEARDPASATGHCGKLKVVNVAQLDTGGVVGTYANNEIGIHRVENRTDKLACTLHVYAPPLRKMKIFNEDGDVHVHVAQATAKGGGSLMGPEGHGIEGCSPRSCFNVDAWNSGTSCGADGCAS